MSVACFDIRLCKAQCCALELADKYVVAYNQGRATDEMFNTLMMVGAYMDTLERHNETQVETDLCDKKKTVYLPCTDPEVSTCLSDEEIEKIFDHLSTLCGGCSCNCD